MWEKVKNSRKFRTMVTAIIGLVIVDVAGLDLGVEAIAGIVGIVMSYIVGQGVADAGNGGSQ
jgi:hypothetical protein